MFETKAEQLSIADSVKRMRTFKQQCPHESPSWELNPITKIYTRRCSRCGSILETIAQSEYEGDIDE